MKKLIITFICYFCVLGLQGQVKTGEELVDSKHLLEDLNTLEYWISEAHGDPYRYTSPDSLRLRFVEAREKLKCVSSMKSMDFMGLVLPIVAELRDGHSQVFPPNLDRLHGEIILPFQLLFVERKPYVRRNLSNVKGLEGVELLAVNDMPVSQFLTKLLPLMHRDGNIESSRLRRLENPLYLATMMRATGLATSTHKISFRVDGEVKTATIKSLNQSEYHTRLARLNLPKSPFKPMQLSFQSTGDTSVGLLKIASFNPSYFESSQSNFAQKFDELMTEVHQSKVQHLVLDLRHNSGGEDTYVQHVLSYFLKEPFHLYGELTARKKDYKFLPDGKHWDIDPRSFSKNDQGSYDLTRYIWPGLEHTGLDETAPRKDRYTGQLYVLINGTTFSAAADLASHLQHNDIGIFLGEETGGSAIGTVSGYSPTMDLEHSGLKVNMSLFSIKNPYFDTDWTDRGVLPDKLVFPTVADLDKGTDPVLEAALALIRSGKN